MTVDGAIKKIKVITVQGNYRQPTYGWTKELKQDVTETKKKKKKEKKD